MNSAHARIVKVTDLNPHLLCVLCGGYYVDATTIIECLHSFCKSCIVKYLETNKYCPICDVQVHKTKPLLNIRSDRTLQAIVYKLVPGLFQKELCCRKEFYKTYPGSKPKNEESDEITSDSPVYLPSEPILLGVQYTGSQTYEKNNDKRYLNCPAAITIHHLQKLMSTKFNLNNSQKVEFLHHGDLLPDHISLMDLAYMYNWKRKHPVELEYRLLECKKKKIKLSHEETRCENPDKRGQEVIAHQSRKHLDEPDREVQLQISENGIISFQSVDSDNLVNNTIVSAKTDKNVSTPKESIPVNNIQAETIELMKSLENTVSLEFDKSFKSSEKKKESIVNKPENPMSFSKTCEAKPDTILVNNQEKLSALTTINETREVSIDPILTNCNTKVEPNKLDKSKELSSNDELESNTSKVNSSSLPLNISPISVPNTSITIQKVYPGATREIPNTFKQSNFKQPKTEVKEFEGSLKSPTEKNDSIKQINNIRYKTLKTAVKTWNPTIPRSTIMAMKQAQAANQDKGETNKTPAKAPKFFKMRNVPRFLGNPASGVKPMYQVLPGSDLSSQTPQTSSSSQAAKSNNEVTIMKIDPKTLNPIPVSSSAKSSKSTTLSSTKSSNPLTYSSQKPSQSSIANNRSSIRNTDSKSGSISIKPHNTGMPSNPFLLPSHSPHMIYSGFPRHFPSVDAAANRLPSDNQIFRAMSMLCTPSAAFHPSLPPSISMLFNPHHPHQRSHNEKLNLKFPPNDFYKPVVSTTPSVQRVPPSGPHPKIPSGSLHTDPKIAMSINQDSIPKSTPKLEEDQKNPVVAASNESNLIKPSCPDPKDNGNLSMPNNNKHVQNHSRQFDSNIKTLSNGISSFPKLYDSPTNNIKSDKDVNSHLKMETAEISVKSNEKKVDKNNDNNS